MAESYDTMMGKAQAAYQGSQSAAPTKEETTDEFNLRMNRYDSATTSITEPNIRSFK